MNVLTSKNRKVRKIALFKVDEKQIELLTHLSKGNVNFRYLMTIVREYTC